jgi:chromosome segregation ATPase
MGKQSNETPEERLNLYDKIDKLTMQLHSAQAQLKSANAQHDQWIQEKERLTKENNVLKQKVKELTDQLGKNVGQTLTQIETLKRQIETCQQQYEAEEKANEHNIKAYWKAVYAELIDGRILRDIKSIINKEEYKNLKKDEWINTNEIIGLIGDIAYSLYNDGEGFMYLVEEQFTKEMWQKLKEAKELMKEDKNEE